MQNAQFSILNSQIIIGFATQAMGEKIELRKVKNPAIGRDLCCFCRSLLSCIHRNAVFAPCIRSDRGV